MARRTVFSEQRSSAATSFTVKSPSLASVCERRFIFSMGLVLGLATCARTRLPGRLPRQQADQPLERVIRALAGTVVKPGKKWAACHGPTMATGRNPGLSGTVRQFFRHQPTNFLLPRRSRQRCRPEERL